MKSAKCLSAKNNFYTNQQPPQRGVAVRSPVWVGSEKLFAFARVPVTPGTPFAQAIFSSCCPLNDRKRAVRSFLKLGRLSSSFSCLSRPLPPHPRLQTFYPHLFILYLLPHHRILLLDVLLRL